MSTAPPTARSSEQLRAEIASTLTALGAHLDTVSQRLSRERLRQEAMQRLQGVALPAVAAALLLGFALGYGTGRCRSKRRRPWSYAI